MIRFFRAGAPLALLSLTFSQPFAAPIACGDGWTPRAGRAVDVDSIDRLERAVRSARPGDDIRIASGDYRLRSTLEITAANVSIRSRGGDPAQVTLRGTGMTGDAVGVAVSVGAPGVVVADLTIRDVGFHAVQVRGERGASGFTLHNARLLDTGQQLLKVSVAPRHLYADDGLVACSDFSYTTSAPSDYTNGADLLATKGWVIRDNRFARIRGPESQGWRSGPAILVWQSAEDTLVERNIIVDSFRGVAFGLGPVTGNLSRNGQHEYDHLRGIVRNNVIVNLNRWADEAIEANAARDARIEHNTVLVAGETVQWSIGVRFPAGSAVVRNNLTTRPILRRNGGHAETAGNITTAEPRWFVDAPGGNFHLAAEGAPAVDAGVLIPDVIEDFDRAPRVRGAGPDAGAFESALTPPIVRRARL